MILLSPADYAGHVGRELGVSRWIRVDQPRIDQFAACTGDRQFIHVDPERARQTAFGGTIAHGFLLLSLIPDMGADLPRMAGVVMSVNYGLNRVRFLAPVRAGHRIRGRFVLDAFERVGEGTVQTRITVTVEAEGQAKPALVAEWLVRRQLEIAGNETANEETHDTQSGGSP
ncbi:MAG: MaoC family dehydratase [Pseudomonadota bacterium]